MDDNRSLLFHPPLSDISCSLNIPFDLVHFDSSYLPVYLTQVQSSCLSESLDAKNVRASSVKRQRGLVMDMLSTMTGVLAPASPPPQLHRAVLVQNHSLRFSSNVTDLDNRSRSHLEHSSLLLLPEDIKVMLLERYLGVNLYTWESGAM